MFHRVSYHGVGRVKERIAPFPELLSNHVAHPKCRPIATGIGSWHGGTVYPAGGFHQD